MKNYNELKVYTNNGYEYREGDILKLQQLYDQLTADFHDHISFNQFRLQNWFVDEIEMEYIFVDDDTIEIVEIDDNVEQYIA